MSLLKYLSISKNNPITNANKAVNENDLKTAQEAVVAWLGDRWVSDIDKDDVIKTVAIKHLSPNFIYIFSFLLSLK